MSVPTHNIAGTVNVVQSGEYNLSPFMRPPSAFVFSHEGKQLSISFKDGRLVVDSDMEMDESAKQFFKYFKEYVDNYIEAVVPHNNLKYLEWCATEGNKHE